MKSRMDSLQHFKKPWAHEQEPIKGLLNAVNVSFLYTHRLPSKLDSAYRSQRFALTLSVYVFKALKPTVLIGSSGVGRTFTKEVVEAMSTYNEVFFA